MDAATYIHSWVLSINYTCTFQAFLYHIMGGVGRLYFTCYIVHTGQPTNDEGYRPASGRRRRRSVMDDGTSRLFFLLIGQCSLVNIFIVVYLLPTICLAYEYKSAQLNGLQNGWRGNKAGGWSIIFHKGNLFQLCKKGKNVWTTTKTKYKTINHQFNHSCKCTYQIISNLLLWTPTGSFVCWFV